MPLRGRAWNDSWAHGHSEGDHDQFAWSPLSRARGCDAHHRVHLRGPARADASGDRGRAEPYPGGNANAEPDGDSHANPSSHGNRGADANRSADANPDHHAWRDAYSYRDAYADR